MKLTMREDDVQAMGVLMDRESSAKKDAAYAAVDGRLRERVARVEKVLAVLGQMPAEEPPRDLAARTLRLILGSAARPLPAYPAGVTADGRAHA